MSKPEYILHVGHSDVSGGIWGLYGKEKIASISYVNIESIVEDEITGNIAFIQFDPDPMVIWPEDYVPRFDIEIHDGRKKFKIFGVQISTRMVDVVKNVPFDFEAMSCDLKDKW